MWYGTISIEQVENLEEIFAELDLHGWIIPIWLQELKNCVMMRDRAEIFDSVLKPHA